MARALVTRSASAGEDHVADFDEVDKSIRAIEKQVGGLDAVKTSAETVQKATDKILDRVRVMREELVRQTGKLDKLVEGLQAALDPDESV